MSPEEREALRRAAEEATEGEWWVNPDGYAAEVVMRSQPSSCIADCGGYEMDPDEFIAASADAAFIAATDPPTVLALLDEVARLSAALEVAREALETSLLVAAEAAVHAGINGLMRSGQNSSDALDLIESMARTALARIDKEAQT